MPLHLNPLSQSKQKYLIKLKQKKYRYKFLSYICEGWIMFKTAYESSPNDIQEIIVNDSFKSGKLITQLSNLLSESNIPVFECSDKSFKSMSNEKTPSGIVFVMRMRFFSAELINNIKDTNCIFLENVADPGNLGTIIRTATWYGFTTMLLSQDSVDPYNPKVVRATAGGIFCMTPYLNISLHAINEFGNRNNYHFVGTTVTNGEPLRSWKVSDKNIIFFGNEASGLTTSALQLLHKKKHA